MFKDLLQRLGFGAIAVVLAAFAGGIAFVAVAYALFAFLETRLSPAGAGAITAAVFAVVAAGLAFLLPTAAPKKADIAAMKPKLDQRTVAFATEAGVAVLGILGDLLISRRLKRQSRPRRKAPKVVERVVRVDDRVATDPREAELRKARQREEKALAARRRAEKSRQKAEKKLRSVRLKQLNPKRHS
jgi:hypothetical protein